MRARLVQQENEGLELVLGVQSPYEAAESIAFLLGQARAPFKPARINTQSPISVARSAGATTRRSCSM